MNYLKIQQDLIKELVNKPTRRKFVRIGHFDDDIAVITEHAMYLIPNNEFILDYDKVKIDLPGMEEKTLKSMIPDTLYAVKKTNEIRVIPKDGRTKEITCDKYLIDNKIPLFIDNKLTKYFNGENTYKGYNSISPLFVYEYDKFVGFVLPVRVMVEEGKNE